MVVAVAAILNVCVASFFHTPSKVTVPARSSVSPKEGISKNRFSVHEPAFWYYDTFRAADATLSFALLISFIFSIDIYISSMLLSDQAVTVLSKAQGEILRKYCNESNTETESTCSNGGLLRSGVPHLRSDFFLFLALGDPSFSPSEIRAPRPRRPEILALGEPRSFRV
jgi:hypothetical protein